MKNTFLIYHAKVKKVLARKAKEFARLLQQVKKSVKDHSEVE